MNKSNTKSLFLRKRPKSVSDKDGHYDIDGVSLCENQVIVASDGKKIPFYVFAKEILIKGGWFFWLKAEVVKRLPKLPKLPNLSSNN